MLMPGGKSAEPIKFPVVIGSPAYRLPELKQPQDAFAENFCAENGLPPGMAPWFALAWLQGQQTERLRNAAQLYAQLRGAL